MRPRHLSILVVVTALSLGILPTGAAGQSLVLNADTGYCERVSGRNGRMGADMIAFIWEPELQRSIALYAVAADCERQNINGFYTGSNRATFKNIRLTGLFTESWISLSRKNVKLRNGIAKKMAIWDITSAVRAVMGADGLVLVDGTVKLGGQVRLGDLVGCAIGVVEVDSRVLSSNSEAEKLRAFEEAANKTVFRRWAVPELE